MNRKMLLLITGIVVTLGIVTSFPSAIKAKRPTPSAEQCAEVEKAKNLIQQASQLYKQGKYAEAIPLVQRALAMQEKVLGAEHPDVALSLIALGELHLKLGNHDQAESLFRRSRTTRLYSLGSENPDREICQNQNSRQ